MTTTEELVAQVNKVLDDIGIDMDGLFETFDVSSISYRLGENLSLLQGLEEELSRRVGGEVTPSTGGMGKRDRDPPTSSGSTRRNATGFWPLRGSARPSLPTRWPSL